MSNPRISKSLGMFDVSRHLCFAGLVLRDLLGIRRGLYADTEHLQATMDWLCRAHDMSDRQGVSSGYSWLVGWQEPYPETTGYIIPTFLNYAQLTGDAQYAERARRMADWEIEIQLSDGAVRGGIGLNAYPVVFNTGQVILGWTAMHRHSSESKYLDAARRACDWLVRNQDSDGKWSKHTYQHVPHAYHSRVAWPMLEVHALTDEAAYRQAAVRNVEWVLSLVDADGWIDQMGFKPNQPPFTHTIAYTLRGLFECARMLEGEIVGRIDNVVQQACERLFMRYECRKRDPRGMPRYLPGEFMPGWRSKVSYSCLTGNVQLAIVFIKLFEQGGDPRFLNAALKLIDQVKRTQSLRAINPAVRGAVAGSYPIWGDYIRFGYPNWAAKFLADALMLSHKIMAELQQEASR